jgi:hypothetical protein
MRKPDGDLIEIVVGISVTEQLRNALHLLRCLQSTADRKRSMGIVAEEHGEKGKG